MLGRHLVLILVLAAFVTIATGGIAARPAAGAAPSVDWPSYNNDLESDRYVALDEINTTNVGSLHVACALPIGAPQSLESGLIEIGGTLYLTETALTMAIDATTCKQRWSTPYAGNTAGWPNRGAAAAGGLVFRGFGDGHVVALNAATGAVVWNRTVIAAGSLEAITAAPIVWNGMLFIGTANGEGGQLCHVMALDQATGTVLWSDQNVPNPGGPGASTWIGAAHIAGGATWSSFTIDAAAGKLYVPVGNPAPDYDTRDRIGTNLDTNAVLQLDPTSGALGRTWQFDPEDDHDWDQAATPAIVTLAGGIRVALSAGKDGLLRSVNVATSQLRWSTPITTITNANAPITTSGTHFCPGGAVFWNGPAYSPATGLAYVNSVDHCRTVYREATPAPYVPGKGWLGASKVVPDATQSGWLYAVDATTGAPQWKYHSTAPLVAGVTPTAGGLVFTADLLGNVLAFNAKSGTLLAKIPTGLPAGAGVIAYEVAGKQYVAVAAGMTSSEFSTPTVKPQLLVLSL